MDIFVCPRCGHQFNRKYRLVNHINRIFVCKPKILDIPVDTLKLYNGPNDDNRFIIDLQARSNELYEQYLLNQLNKKHTPDPSGSTPVAPKIDFYPSENTPVAPKIDLYPSENTPDPSDKICPEKFTKSTENSNKIMPEKILKPIEHNGIVINGKNKARLECKYCKTVFSSINSRSRHELYRCKLIESNKEINLKEINENSKLKLPISNRNIQSINNITNESSNNNNCNNTNSNNTNTINIQQNIYGEEKFHYIKGDIENRLELLAASDSKKFFRELFKYAYFDPKHPENKTFKKDKVKAAYLLVLRSLPHNWEYEDKDTVFHDKLRQILSWLELDSSINIDNTTVQKIVEDITTDKEPISTQMRKQLENMENTNYTNKMEKQTNLLTVKFNNELDSYKLKIEKEIRLKYKNELQELEYYRSQIKK